ncbi:MAG: hypothetical protein U0167_10100 [bacterium]
MALTMLLLASPGARAQISPGPLSRAHQNLEGVKNCLKCHGLGEKPVDEQCLACHLEIAKLRETGEGFHAREGKGACAKCHVEHGGLDFDLVHWEKGEPQAFDHARAGWVLDGKHLGLECEKCHRPDLRVSPIAKIREGGLPVKSLLGLATDCLSCHKDPHQGRFGNTCQQCHNTTDFHHIVQKSFDHDRTRYPLQGAHKTVACEKCHKDGYKVLPKFDACRSCHEDPHRGEATLAGAVVDCASCHTVNAYLPSTFDVVRHAKSKYPLEGKHARVACRDCHAESKEPKARFAFRPAFVTCTSCHEAAHGRQLATRADGGKCESCHDVRGFEQSSFGVPEHAKTAFALNGAHVAVKCEACHGPERAGLPPLPPVSVTGPAKALFRFTLEDCISCHHDPHQGGFGSADSTCLSCHLASAFRPARVDVAMHAKYSFALDGAHAVVACSECHKDLAAPRPASTLVGTKASWPSIPLKGVAKECAACHKDPHGKQFVADGKALECTRCHGLDAFRPASRFDHDRDSSFSLAGAHAKVACTACHAKGKLPDGSEGIVYRSVPKACEACHLPSSTTPSRGSS